MTLTLLKRTIALLKDMASDRWAYRRYYSVECLSVIADMESEMEKAEEKV
jgi:hypothetical protein